MKNYLAVFLGSPDALQKYLAMEEKMRKENDQKGMQAWMAWAQKYQSEIVNVGSPLGKTKRIDKSGISDVRNELGAWCVVKANSHDEAAQMFIDHPHFTIFPGERVEVMECLPIPSRE